MPLLAAGALSAPQIFPSPNILHAASKGEKVRCVVVGCGGRSSAHFGAIRGEQLVAVVDADERKAGGSRGGKVEAFTDYRVMFDKIHKQIDAVFVATPNHHHAPPSMIAMQLGKSVYCEKPLCHDVAEARKLREMVAQIQSGDANGQPGALR